MQPEGADDVFSFISMTDCHQKPIVIIDTISIKEELTLLTKTGKNSVEKQIVDQCDKQ